jgi:GNAT superfamily N-acetyltransferase
MHGTLQLSETERLGEAIERKALAELHDAAPADLRAELGFEQVEIGGALVSIAARDPSFVLNRTIGLGVERPAPAGAVRAIRAVYDHAGIDRPFVHRLPSARPDDLADRLGSAGFGPHRRWMKFVRGVEAPAPARSDLAVREIGRDYADAFGAIVGAAFDLTETAWRLFGPLAGRPGWHLFMSFDGDEPAGTGARFVDGEIGWLDWGSTAPAVRQRGGQSALLAARIAAARRLGCRLLFTETGEWVEGDPQHSYHNIRRAGFAEAGLRENWVPV